MLKLVPVSTKNVDVFLVEMSTGNFIWKGRREDGSVGRNMVSSVAISAGIFGKNVEPGFSGWCIPGSKQNPLTIPILGSFGCRVLVLSPGDSLETGGKLDSHMANELGLSFSVLDEFGSGIGSLWLVPGFGGAAFLGGA